MFLLGLAGKAGAGKTYIANLCKEEFGLMPWGFANPLKMRIYGISDKWDFPKYFIKDRPRELRRFLQIEGTENSRDKYRNDFWVRQAEAFCHIMETYWDIRGITFCDIRFPNEVGFIQNNNGVVLKVIGDTETSDEEISSHRSEALVDSLKYDGIIDNRNHPSNEELIKRISPYISRKEENY